MIAAAVSCLVLLVVVFGGLFATNWREIRSLWEDITDRPS